MIKLTTRSGAEWERVVFAEVVIPETPNVFGDFMSKEEVKTFAYSFMRRGFGIDVEHNNVDVSGSVSVVESFVTRPGDPDFTDGSWVVAMYIGNDQLWQDVLDNKINGFSYEALMQFFPAILQESDNLMRTGTTEPDLVDGHTHEFFVIVDLTNRPVTGGTDTVNGHSHTITTHTTTDKAAGHTHRYNLVRSETA